MRGGKRTESGGSGNAGNVPHVRAILVSDLHLQARPPVARSTEPDWFAAMQKPLEEIAALATTHAAPVLYAGDIFDRWNAGPDVINFALRHLPRGYAVPGQHDLPNHNYAEMERSAYGVLVQVGHIENLPPCFALEIAPGIKVTGFPWGMPPVPLLDKPVAGVLYVAIIHKFIWIKGCGYPGADEAARLSHSNRGGVVRDLQGYHVAAYGDNHKGFVAKPVVAGDPWVVNCGGFMRRKTDERDYKPGVGLLLADGTVARHYLDTTGEKFIAFTEAEEAIAQKLNMGAFVEELKTLGTGDALNFVGAMQKFMDVNKTATGVRQVIMEAMG